MGISLKPVKGTRDFYPQEQRRRRWLFGHWRDVAQAFGFEEYDACVLEHEELYTRKAGDEIVDQLYNFSDKGDRRVALRPEMTPSLARMVLAKHSTLSLPLRWFSIPQCFRYERMQRGRKREHFQWNMDIIGLESVAAEVELMGAQVEVLRRLGLDVSAAGSEVRLRVSDRRILQGFLHDVGIVDADTFAAVCVIVDKRDKIGRAATAELLLQVDGVASAAAEKILDLLEATNLEQLRALVGTDNAGVASLVHLQELADASGFGHLVQIDPSIVRGLSYYTGTVWEVFAAVGSMGRALAGGGRYDGLMEHLGGKPTPMVGFGFGDVAIVEFLEELKRLPSCDRQLDAVVYPFAAEQFLVANKIAAALRQQGQQVMVDYSCRRFKHVIKAAEQAGAEKLYILGQQEIADGVCKVRRLDDRSERSHPLATNSGLIRSRLGAHRYERFKGL